MFLLVLFRESRKPYVFSEIIKNESNMKTIILKIKLWIIHVIECFTMRQNRGYIVVFANTDKYEYPTTEIHVCKSYYQATRILKGEQETLKNEDELQECEEIDDWFGVTD